MPRDRPAVPPMLRLLINSFLEAGHGQADLPIVLQLNFLVGFAQSMQYASLMWDRFAQGSPALDLFTSIDFGACTSPGYVVKVAGIFMRVDFVHHSYLSWIFILYERDQSLANRQLGSFSYLNLFWHSGCFRSRVQYCRSAGLDVGSVCGSRRLDRAL